MEKRMESLKGALFVIATGMCWGLTGTVQALAPEGASSITIGSARVFGAGLLLFIWAITYRGPSIIMGAWHIGGICLAAIGLTAYQFAFFSAVRLTGVAVGTMIAIGSAPVMAGILGKIFFHENLSRRWYIATLLAVTGCSLLAIAGNKGFTRVSLPGALLAFCAAFAYAVEGVGLRMAKERNPLDTIALVSILSALMALPWLLAGDISWVWQPRGALCVFVLTVFATVLPLLLFTKGLRMISLGKAYTLSLSEPLTAWILSATLLGEELSLLGSFSVLILFGGIIILACDKK